MVNSASYALLDEGTYATGHAGMTLLLEETMTSESQHFTLEQAAENEWLDLAPLSQGGEMNAYQLNSNGQQVRETDSQSLVRFRTHVYVVPGLRLATVVLEQEAVHLYIAIGGPRVLSILPRDIGYRSLSEARKNVTTVPHDVWETFQHTPTAATVELIALRLRQGWPDEERPGQGLLFARKEVMSLFLQCFSIDVPLMKRVLEACQEGYYNLTHKTWKLRNGSLAACSEHSGKGKRDVCEENLCYYQPDTYSCTSRQTQESSHESASSGYGAVTKMLRQVPEKAREGYSSLVSAWQNRWPPNNSSLKAIAQYLPERIETMSKIQKELDQAGNPEVETLRQTQQYYRGQIKQFWKTMFQDKAQGMEKTYAICNQDYTRLMEEAQA